MRRNTQGTQRTILEDPRVASATMVFQALSEPARIKILQAIQDEERCICEFVDVLGLSQPAVSYHFKILGEAGLITARREGKKILCKVKRQNFVDHMFGLIESLNSKNSPP